MNGTMTERTCVGQGAVDARPAAVRVLCLLPCGQGFEDLGRVCLHSLCTRYTVQQEGWAVV